MYSRVVITLALIGMYSHAHAAVLCAPKSGEGTVRVREACKKNERQLDPATLGLQGPAVYDANGIKVGDIIGTQSPATQSQVLFKVGGLSFPLYVNPPRLGLRGSLYFESSDCSGTGYTFPEYSESLYPRSVISLPGSTLYLADPTVSPRSILVQSELRPEAEVGCLQMGPYTSGPLVPALPLIDLDTLFTPPFSVR